MLPEHVDQNALPKKEPSSIEFESISFLLDSIVTSFHPEKSQSPTLFGEELRQGFEAWLQVNGEHHTAYLQAKIPLYNNLRSHFDSIAPLQQILLAYMYVGERYERSKAVKGLFKRSLTNTGVFNDQEILEFLLLVGERHRSFEDVPNTDDEDQIAQYLFEKYRGKDEKWHRRTSHFFKSDYGYYQKDLVSSLEATALRIIARSRAHEEDAIDDIPEKATDLIQKADEYFQKAFYVFFQRQAPIRLTEVTRLTTQTIEYANNITNRTYIDIINLRDSDSFVHFVIHEGLHLCFEGLDQKPIEESLIEYYIENMFQKFPTTEINYHPVSRAYTDWKNGLKVLFDVFPELEVQLTGYFLGGDLQLVKQYLAMNFIGDIHQQIQQSPFYVHKNTELIEAFFNLKSS